MELSRYTKGKKACFDMIHKACFSVASTNTESKEYLEMNIFFHVYTAMLSIGCRVSTTRRVPTQTENPFLGPIATAAGSDKRPSPPDPSLLQGAPNVGYRSSKSPSKSTWCPYRAHFEACLRRPLEMAS